MRGIRAAFLLAAGAAAIQSCGSSTDGASHAAPSGGTAGAMPDAGAGSSAGGVSGTGAGGTAPGAAGQTVGASGAAGEGGAAGGGASDAHPLTYVWQLSYDQSYAAHVAVDSKGAAVVSGTFFDS